MCVIKPFQFKETDLFLLEMCVILKWVQAHDPADSAKQASQVGNQVTNGRRMWAPCY